MTHYTIHHLHFHFDHYLAESFLGISPEQMITESLLFTNCIKKVKLGWSWDEYVENEETGDWENVEYSLSATGFEILKVYQEFITKIIGKPNHVSPQDLDQACIAETGTEDWTAAMIDTTLVQKIQHRINNNNSIPYPLIPAFADAWISAKHQVTITASNLQAS